jgi:antitoxin (DNA-binding transcriptional repressor) of toxin-antitoxin stability system
MKTFSVAQARAGLASLLAKAQQEIVIIARYGKPVGLLLGVPPAARATDIKALVAHLQTALADQVGGLPPATGRTDQADRPRGAGGRPKSR